VVAFAWRAATHPSVSADQRRAWRLMSFGFACLAFGDLMWALFDGILGQNAFPSPADIGLLSAYPFLFAGLLAFSAGPRSTAERAKFGLDAAMVLLGGGMVTWHFVLRPLATAGFDDPLPTILALIYPVLDLVLLGGIFQVLQRGPDLRATWALRALLVAFASYMISDFAFGVISVQTGYVAGDWPDIARLLGQYLWVVSAVAQVGSTTGTKVRPPLVRDERRWVSAMPYGAVAIGYALLLWAQRGDFGTAAGDLLLAAVVLTGLVIARQIAAHRENARLLQGHAERRSEARFRSLVQHASDLTTVVDVTGLIQYQSPSIERVAGHRPEVLVRTPVADLVHPEDAPHFLVFLNEVAHQPRGRTQLEWRLARHDGGWLHVETTATNLLSDPEVEGIVLNSRDVTERKALEDQLRRQAFHDPLTDLANRALFRDRVEHALSRAGRQDEVLSVLYLDLDNFKTVNDSLGHPVGDALLVEVAARLQGCLRSSDTMARLGGDEFAILLEDATGEHSPESVAERISLLLRVPFLVGTHDVLVSASIGITDASESRDGVDELLRNADVAMYAAKGLGKGRAERFEPAMYAVVRQRLELTAELRRALDQHEFRVFYQPIVDLHTSRIREVEALVRWQHPDRGLVSPLEFIPLAEETGLIVPLGRWVLEQACRQARAWHVEHPSEPLLVMGVNLSGRQFQDPELVADVERVLRDTGLPPGCLKLEITESVAMQNAARAEITMQALKDLGVRLAIDDFGTGYSSLQYLKRFPVDTLKIDKSFVDGLGADEQDTAIVQSVVALAKALHLDVTGEGVETRSQHAQLRLLGVERAQGFLFARPMPPQDIGAMLVDRDSALGVQGAA
jgi:diguanylate cyclase (GGDEF)-like protein/PAS domain S-box-containing protein